MFAATNWTICPGQHWAIVGGNGSGKSLLGDAIRGRLPLVAGELEYGFRPPPKLTPEECIGHVSFEHRKPQGEDWVVQSRWSATEQEHALGVKAYLSYERVMEVNPFEVGASRGQMAFYKRLHRGVDLLGIRGLLQRKVISLSNGERQKVEIARALAHPLRVLIVDEPFTGLDSRSRMNLRRIFNRLTQEGIVLIFITANPEELPPKVRNWVYVADCQVTALKKVKPNSRKLIPLSNERPTVRQTHVSAGFSPSIGEVLVDMRDVSVRYGRRTIVHKLSLEVRAGESWAVLGPNGSGKTTLLSLITGDNPQAYSNHVVVFGKQRGTGESLWDIKRQIGFLSPELHASFPENLTCFEAVASGFNDTLGLFEPISRKQAKEVVSLLKQFGMAAQIELPMFALSTGLQRMALLARALVKKPKLLVLDEPCQGLDEEHKYVFLHALSNVLAIGKETALYVTHQPSEIPREIRNVLRLAG